MKLLILLAIIVSGFGSASDYETEILPFYYKAPGAYFSGVRNARLYYKKFEVPSPKATLIYVTGWTESHLKYAELIYELNQKGYSVFSFDNRGMGFSSRLTQNPQQVHVREFDDYVLDLNLFIQTVVQESHPKKLAFLSHSMGGLIVARYLALFPNTPISAAVFSAPMFQIQTGKFPLGVAYAIAKSNVLFGNGTNYLYSQGDTTFDAAADFLKQTTTHDPVRWKRKTDNWKRHPALLQAGSTNQWLVTSLDTTHWLSNGGLHKVRVPILIFQAEQDTLVVNSAQQGVCGQVLDCLVFPFKNGYHELFLEVDAIRNKMLAKMFEFLER